MKIISISLAQHPVRIVMLICFIVFQYSIHQWMILGNNLLAAIVLRLIKIIESSVRQIILIPVRNNAVKILRQEHIKKHVSMNSYYDKSRYGVIYMEMKRIEYILAGTERESFNILQQLPLMYLYVKKFIIISKRLSLIIAGLNFMSTLIAKLWIKTRVDAFKAEEELGSELYLKFANSGRVDLYNALKVKLESESKLYSKAISGKQQYRIFLYTINMVPAFILFYFQCINITHITTYFFMISSYIEIFISGISIAALCKGMNLPNIHKVNRNKTEIVLTSVNVPNVFDNISLNIAEGSKIVITGVNGSGKTLLLRMIAGYEPGYAQPQVRAIFIDSNVTVLKEDFRLLKYNEIWKMQFKEYHKLLYKPNLSKGQQLFVVIVRMLLGENSVILIDEAMDSVSDKPLSDLIELIHSTPHTVIITSHHQSIISSFKDHLKIHDKKID